MTKVLHTGMRVKNLEDSIQLYVQLGFEVDIRFTKDIPRCKAAVLKKGEQSFELFEFEDPAHEYVKYISNHIAFYSNDLKADVADFISRGYKLVIPITEGTVLRYSFVQDPSGAFCYELATEKIVTS